MTWQHLLFKVLKHTDFI